ncbi:phytosulfokine receptor 1-like [Camellia sinensis]|uniref:phytosulfokine receptor 1-like n=1 Tax=Camellia sinensis TaxID=4442 RepID=UPI0010361110|nr:phytosulfokine receptor 1-like [Camellia sinensis]
MLLAACPEANTVRMKIGKGEDGRRRTVEKMDGGEEEEDGDGEGDSQRRTVDIILVQTQTQKPSIISPLDGIISPWLGNFEFLLYIDLSNNSFTGEIPKNLTGLDCLISRDLLLEDLSLGFPFPCFVKQNISLTGLQYNQIWRFAPTLDLSNNFLTGPIRSEFGNLKKLHCLDLKCNNLSGNILENLSGMTSIETLDLSHNDLSGAIPLSLVNLNFLSKFSVTYNQLNGAIPTGGQFETFPNLSFEGNLGLCGEHSLSCSIGNQVPQVSLSKSMWGEIIVEMSFGIGFETTFAVMFLFVLNNKVLQKLTYREVP